MIAISPYAGTGTGFNRFRFNYGIGGYRRKPSDMKAVKSRFIKYWKRIIRIIYPYKERLLTGEYIFIWPVIHIRTFSAVY